MRAPRILLPVFAVFLLLGACTSRLPTIAEPSLSAGTQAPPAEEQDSPGTAPATGDSDTVQTTERGIGTIGSGG